MTIGGVLLPDVLRLTEMEVCGAVVVIGHPLGEDQDPVTMDLLIGAVTDPLLVTIHPLLNRPDQPVIIKTMAGQLLSVRPKVSWEYPGCQDICQTTRVYHASSILLALVT